MANAVNENKIRIFFIIMMAGCLISCRAWGIIDSYNENFDDRTPDATIDSHDFWSVTQGGDENAVIDDNVTASGTGRSLKISDTSPVVITGRSYDYGDLSPTWVSYVVKASSGSKQSSVPSSGIAAVTFDYSGKILASDGANWVDTGMTYSSDKWYEVILKLDFSARQYDLYISSYGVPKIQFIPVKSGLEFIDPSAGKLSKLGFTSASSASGTKDSYLDDVSVTYIYRLEFITTPQNIVQDGVSGPIVLQLQNSNSEPQTAIADYTLELKSSSAGGKFSLNIEPWTDVHQIVLSKSSQLATFYYKDSAVGAPVITVSEYPEKGWLDALQQQKIIAKTAHFEVLSTTPQIAGQDFKLDITAKDEDGNIAEDYSGTIDLSLIYVSPSSGTGHLSVEQASGFSGGKLELYVNYPDAGTVSVLVSDHDDLSRTGTSGSIVFTPASFSVSAATPQIVGQPFGLEIKAMNSFGDLTANYKGQMRLSPVFILSPSDGASLSPSALTEEDFSAGIAEVSLAYNRLGIIKIKVEDALYPACFGQSAEIKFVPAAVKITTPVHPSGRKFFYVGEVFSSEISITDTAGSPIPNFTGMISIVAAPNLEMLSEYAFTAADMGKHTFFASSKSAGIFTVKVSETADNLSAETDTFEVKEAIIQVIDTTSLVGTTEVIIQLVDEEGKIITTESDLEVLVKLFEAIDNSSASSMSTVTPVRFINGQIKIPVTDTEAEEVGVFPQTQFGLKVKPGKITFGRVAKSGIGTIMWREVKEKKKK